MEIIHPRPVAWSNSHPDLPEAKGMKGAMAVLRLMAYATCPWINVHTLFVHPATQAKHQQ